MAPSGRSEILQHENIEELFSPNRPPLSDPMLWSIFRRSGNRFGEKNMLKKLILREFLSIG
jgi:hypothetical protein